MHLFGYVEVKDYRKSKEPPVIAQPDNPQEVQSAPNGKLNPPVLGRIHSNYFTELMIASNA